MNPARTSAPSAFLPSSSEPLLTARQVAQLLGVPLGWVYDNSSLLPTFRVGRSLRFRASELETWLEARREGGVGGRP